MYKYFDSHIFYAYKFEILHKIVVDATPVEKAEPNEHFNGAKVSVGNGYPDCNLNATEQLPGASKMHQPQYPTVSINVTMAGEEETLEKFVSKDIAKKDLLEDDKKDKDCPIRPKDDTSPTSDNEINSPVVSIFHKMIDVIILI